MKKPQNTIFPRCLFILLVVAALQLMAQNAGVVDGKVVDAETGKPLFFVNVFLANTTIGATTAGDGYFLVKNLPPGDYDLVAHHIGYELETRKIRITGTDSLRYDFELKPKVLRGEEIVVFAPKPKGWLWRQNLKRFTEEFIGDTRYARYCKILNPEVLNFQIDPDTRALIASSDQMLEIENRALGYHIDVVLQEYRSLQKTSLVESRLQYVVLPRFEPIEPRSEKELEEWQKSRQFSYEGSLKHFLSSLVARSGDFKIFAGSRISLDRNMGTLLSAEMLSVTPDDMTPYYRLEFHNYLKVIYGTGRIKTSIIRLPERYALFDIYGNLIDPLSVELSGYWAQKRMADTLPTDYRPSF